MAFKGRVIGLTGNIACGKSTVGRYLAELGVPVIDADQVAREVTGPGSPATVAIAGEFGPGVLDSSGTIDREKLRSIVFRDVEKRRLLEAILHPAIRDLSHEKIAAALALGRPVVIYEATLLVETGRAREFNGLLVVTCPPEAQLARLRARDPGLTAEFAQRIADSQVSQEDKARVATWLISNDGSLDELRTKVEDWHSNNVARRK